MSRRHRKDRRDRRERRERKAMQAFRAGKKPGWQIAKGGEGIILAATGLLGIGVLGAVFWPWIGMKVLLGVVVALWLLVLYFFRDPHRPVEEQPDVVLSACDGKVVHVGIVHEEQYLGQQALRISVFLSPFDVHVQRMPLSGEVVSVEHRPGRFLHAIKAEAAKVNEHMAMIVKSQWGDVLVKQIAGVLARRCVNYARPGEELAAGQRFGLIRFGSRVDLFISPDATPLVRPGSRVRGGLTTVARFDRSSASLPPEDGA